MHLARLFCLDKRPFRSGAASALSAAGLWLALCAGPAPALAQSPAPAVTPAAPSQPATAASAPASRPTPARTASANKNGSKQSTQSQWRDLRPAEQAALAPLAGKWDTISAAQKRKWLALSHNFPKMPVAEQARLHSRMSEWAALSPQQRTEARLNFGATQQLSPDDKKAKWEAYQALPPEEKSKLAASAAKPPVTAAAVKPVPPGKLATIPKPKLGERPPRPAAAPAKVYPGAAPAAGAASPAPAPTPAPTPAPASPVTTPAR